MTKRSTWSTQQLNFLCAVPDHLHSTDIIYLVQKAAMAVHKYGIDKTLIVPMEHREFESMEEVDWEEYDVHSDAFPFDLNGMNIVSIVSSPAYLFHPSDTPDRVRKEWLQPVGMMYAELMESV